MPKANNLILNNKVIWLGNFVADIDQDSPNTAIFCDNFINNKFYVCISAL